MDRNVSSLGSAVPIGAALAITVGIGYAACALAFRLWPDAAMDFMNALFHGLDFRKLARGPAPFDFSSFLVALFVAVVWAFAFGALFGWLIDRFRPERQS
jgi:ribose/xylose/arabinose/galactoside ABC-type transport system permease subunit